jgi:hypothetical protein
MVVFVIVGAPFVYFIWEFVNHALTGRFVASEAGLALVGLVGVFAVLRFVGARAALWDKEPAE